MEEDFIRILVALVTTVIGLSVPVGLYFGVRYGNLKMKELERGTGHPGPDAETAERFARLEREVVELQERVDFAERLLAQPREAERLPGTLH